MSDIGGGDAHGNHDPLPPVPRDDDVEEGTLEAHKAYEVLEIRTPVEEFEAYVRARIATLSQLGEADKAELALRALELGRRALGQVTGAVMPVEPRPALENGSSRERLAR